MADIKITDLTAVASVTATHTFEVTEDPAGTPVSKKATAAQVADFVEGRASLAELIRDTIGTALTAGTNITITPNDGSDIITVTGLADSAIQELARDALGTALTAGTGVTITPNDGADTITISLDGDLATIAGLTATTDNFLQAKASAWASRTPTQVTADLIAMVGDSGSGGTKGLVPAPAAGDAAAAKFLKADGTWAAPSGGGSSTLNNFAATTAPTANDDSADGYAVGSRWLWASLKLEWVCVSAVAGSAVWKPIYDKHITRQLTNFWVPASGNNSQVGTGMAFQGVHGTDTTRTQTSTNTFTRSSRLGQVSSAGAGSNCGFRSGGGNNVIFRDNAFTCEFIFGISDAAAVANARLFVGATQNNFLSSNVDPSTFVNILGVGCDAGETTLSWMENDGSGTATKTAVGTGSLGGSAPTDTRNTDIYALRIEQPSSAGNPTLTLRRINTGDEWTRTPTTDLPVSTVGLCRYFWRSNGSTALAVGIDVFSYSEDRPGLL